MKKRRFTSNGRCKLCGEEFTGGQISGHLEKCRESLLKSGDEQSIEMMHILVKSKYDPQYWLQIAICSDLELDSLDTFLRNVWLECCGHLSQFKINGKSYEDSAPSPGDLFFADEFQTQSTYIELKKILNIGTKFEYVYDFGSSTDLELEVLDIFPASISKGKIILLAHNKKPEMPCSNCGKPSTLLCPECQFKGLPLCEKCAPKHACDEDFLMPLVNSPRTGVCGYCGPVPFEGGDMNMTFEYPNKKLSSSIYDDEEEYYEDTFINHPELYQEPFALDDVILKLWGDKKKSHQEDMKEELEMFLFDSEIFIGIYNNGTEDYIFHHLPTAFKGAQFCIKPTKDEINTGILIPGHRFMPFISEHIHPSDVELTDGKKTIPIELLKNSLKTLFPYIYRLGEKTMFEYLISDNKNNETDSSNRFDPNKEYILTVMDMKDFYKKNKFKHGDLIIFKVEDFINGKLSISYCPEKKVLANKSKIKKWCKLFSQGLEYSIREYGEGIELSKEIATALILKKEFLLNNPVITLEDFLKQSKKYSLKPWQNSGYIIWDESQLPNFDREDYNFDDEEIDFEDESEFSDINHNIQPPNTDSIDTILEELGAELIKPEVEAFIRNELFNGRHSKQALWNRIFEDSINFISGKEILEVTLHKYFDELWEEISNSYKRSDDEIKGPIRAKAIQIKENLLLWLSIVEPQVLDYGRIPKELKELLNRSSLITGILMMLDDPDEIITEIEIKLMISTIENYSDFFEAQKKLVEIIIR